jgi:hypothetical protein
MPPLWQDYGITTSEPQAICINKSWRRERGDVIGFHKTRAERSVRGMSPPNFSPYSILLRTRANYGLRPLLLALRPVSRGSSVTPTVK